MASYAICRDDEGRLLLTRFFTEGHRNSGRWTMPGGGMDWGERPVETVVRELEEETGLVADVGPLVAVFNRWLEAHETMSGEAGHMVGLLYEATNARGELREEFDEGTTDGAAWFTLDEARALPTVDLVDFVLDLLG